MTPTKLECALAYADLGWPVFTLGPTKMPLANCAFCHRTHDVPQAKEACTCLTCHGFYAATSDPARITEMVRRHPRGMLAVRTGGPSGLAVVDVDIKSWMDGRPAQSDPGFLRMTELTRMGLLPSTLTQTTGGGGKHYFYAHPGGYLLSGAGKYGPAVDSKADGAYVVIAPSRNRNGGRYEWGACGPDQPLTPLPEPLAAMVRPRGSIHRKAPPRLSEARLNEAGPGAARPRLRGILEFVLEAPSGARNDRLFWAAIRAGEMVAEGAVEQHVVVAALQRAGQAVGLAANEVGDERCGTIASGLRKGLLASTRQHGEA